MNHEIYFVKKCSLQYFNHKDVAHDIGVTLEIWVRRWVIQIQALILYNK